MRITDPEFVPLLGVRQAAAALGVSRWTMYHWHRTSVVGFAKMAGSLFTTPAEIARLQAEHPQKVRDAQAKLLDRSAGAEA